VPEGLRREALGAVGDARAVQPRVSHIAVDQTAAKSALVAIGAPSPGSSPGRDPGGLACFGLTAQQNEGAPSVSAADSDIDFDAIVVGVGFSGLYLVYRLRELGFTVQAIEAGDDVGGTWYWNRYPGARCDIESMTYSYSWSEELEQEWTWSERYAAQPEILRYLNHVADRFDLRRHIRFGTRVTAAAFDEQKTCWAVTTDAGDVLRAAFLIMATGCLSVPRLPDIRGLDRFEGETYHTALWPHEPVSLAGKRVGIIGTGSSAVQVLPAIAGEAAQVTVFQRTPAFSVPAWNGPLDDETVRAHKARYREYRELARVTGGGNPWHTRKQSIFDETPEQRREEFEKRYRLGGFHLHAAYSDLFTNEEANELVSEFVREKIRERVGDPELAELLCPYDYPLATKRMCVDTGYYEAFKRPNVRLVSVKETPIEEITERGVRVAGEEHELDVLVLATGFDAMTGALLRVDIVGRGGRSLRDVWADGPRTYLGLAIAGFPNLFTVTGPGSPSVLSNMVVSIEQHVEFITDCMVYARQLGCTAIEAKPEAQERWVEHVREVGDASLYPRAADANSWYMGANVPGKPRMLLPYVGGVGEYRRRCEAIARAGYEGFAFTKGRNERLGPEDGAHERRDLRPSAQTAVSFQRASGPRAG
jgi:cation diffusion facilitator CzcD-associated flavoprotein CzcO